MWLGGLTAPPNVTKKPRRIQEFMVRVLPEGSPWANFPAEYSDKSICEMGPVSSSRGMGLQLLRLGKLMAYGCEQNGGLWVHGALVEMNGTGVIMAGPGGVGKTTAAGRLPRPWRILSDDMCLIAKSPASEYWAHPWPTWSRIRQGDLNGSWDVQEAVRVGLICMLSQNEQDQLESVSYHQAVSELMDVSNQTRVYLSSEMDEIAARGANLKCFQNAVNIAKIVPTYRLKVSLAGKFWEEIEKAVVPDRKAGVSRGALPRARNKYS